MQLEQNTDIRLTQYSRSAGCGCKIAPSVLQQILHTDAPLAKFPQLVVGNETSDDAAAYDMGDGNLIISTTDFFMPIVDDAFDFGRVAAANSISDVYAMGGRPLMAIAILGWPIEKLPAELASRVLDGARAICTLAGIPLAGGHSIDSAEPIFGLAVTGICCQEHLKRNNTANAGDLLFLTKPIGVGVLATAMKRDELLPEHLSMFVNQLTSLNNIGQRLGMIAGVSAMTDVTGFGLAGHLIEMAEGSGLSAEIEYSKIPLVPGVADYLKQNIVPDATYRNWNAFGNKIEISTGIDYMQAFCLLPDPQTNGGLLVAVDPSSANEVINLFSEFGLSEHLLPIGRVVEKAEKVVICKP